MLLNICLEIFTSVSVPSREAWLPEWRNLSLSYAIFPRFRISADRSFLEWFLPESVIVLVTFVGADETMPRHVTTGVLLLVTGASIHPKGPKRTQKDPKGTQKDPKGPKIN